MAIRSRFLALSLIATSSIGAALYSADASADNIISSISDYVVVPDKDVLKVLAPAPRQTVSHQVRLFVWNTHKGEDGNKWAQDLKILTADRDFVLLQEGMDDNFMPSVLKSIDHLGWVIGQSFYMKRDHDGTGVITGAAAMPVSQVFQRTSDTEPVTKTPKVSMFSSYKMDNGQMLLVINIHGINFTSIDPFYRQIARAMEIARAWQGPLIFAGDFNTWSSARTDYLRKVASQVGLAEVIFAQDPRGMVLDHVFVRDCAVQRAVVHGNIKTSDHKPLSVDLACGR